MANSEFTRAEQAQIAASWAMVEEAKAARLEARALRAEISQRPTFAQHSILRRRTTNMIVWLILLVNQSLDIHATRSFAPRIDNRYQGALDFFYPTHHHGYGFMGWPSTWNVLGVVFYVVLLVGLFAWWQAAKVRRVHEKSEVNDAKTDSMIRDGAFDTVSIPVADLTNPDSPFWKENPHEPAPRDDGGPRPTGG